MQTWTLKKGLMNLIIPSIKNVAVQQSNLKSPTVKKTKQNKKCNKLFNVMITFLKNILKFLQVDFHSVVERTETNKKTYVLLWLVYCKMS